MAPLSPLQVCGDHDAFNRFHHVVQTDIRRYWRAVSVNASGECVGSCYVGHVSPKQGCERNEQLHRLYDTQRTVARRIAG